MKKYGIIPLVLIILISLGFNFYQLGEIRRAESQLAIVNNRVLDNVEQYTRWSIRFIDEIQSVREMDEVDEFMQKTTFSHLQNSLDDLVEYYAYFVDLKNENREVEGVCTQTLESLRSIRSVVNHSLQEKFDMNGYQFTSNDYIFLEGLENGLQEFLTNIYRVAEANDTKLVISIPEEQKDRLEQVATDLGELASRYRHSVLLDAQEEFLTKEEARVKLKDIALYWLQEEKLEEFEIEGIHHRSGISHYSLETEELLLWMDAKSGVLRYMEYSPKEAKETGVKIERNDALEIARDFHGSFKGLEFEELAEEFFTYNQNGNGAMVYAFRFTPIENNLRVSSDAFEVNINATTGEVVRFRNRFHETSVPSDSTAMQMMLELKEPEDVENIVAPLTPEKIMEIHEEEFPDLDYQGRAVIRNFYTEFQPRVVKVFFQEIDGQRAALYFDEFSGRELERNYYPFEAF